MHRLSGLQGLEVVDESGKRVGHVFDLLTEHDQLDEPPKIKSFLVGRGGLARRLGIRRGSARVIALADVIRIEEGYVTVRIRDDGW